MANSSAPAQTDETISPPISPPTQNGNPAEEEIYNLDDPYLMHKVVFSQKPIASGSITCRFLAIPINEPGSLSVNLAQYGSVVCETKDKLIIRVPGDKIDLLDRIQQLWVTKYLAPLTECRITFDVPSKMREKSTTVIIQRVLGKVGEGKDDDESEGDGPVDDPAVTVTVTDGRETTPDEVGRRDGDEEPWRKRRRRSNSLPLPSILAELDVMPWHPPQLF